MTTIIIWAKRFTPEKWNFWNQERKCQIDDAKALLTIFRKSEPDVIFTVSLTKPKWG